jgi:hypothetical protein
MSRATLIYHNGDEEPVDDWARLENILTKRQALWFLSSDVPDEEYEVDAGLIAHLKAAPRPTGRERSFRWSKEAPPRGWTVIEDRMDIPAE